MQTILVVDDQLGMVGSLQQKSFLRNYEQLPYTFVFESCAVDKSFDADLAVAAAERESEVALVLLDLKFGADGELLGFDILRRLTARFPSLPVLVMSSADRDVENLGRCLEEGAVGFIEKHRSPEYFRNAVEQAMALMRSHVILGQSEPLRELRRQAARLSPYDQIPVLVVGERGTGKERVARYIHHSGPRSHGAFVAVNCAGMPDGLFESEFFGVEKGAYTGAHAQRAGYLERSHGGTLFLDEVGTLPLSMQAKLLRVLQEHAFYRIGSTAGEVVSNFQLISATNSTPEDLLKMGLLRDDFYDRIAAVTVRTPPLRSCLADLPLLATTFLQRVAGASKRFTPSAFAVMSAYAWPGNVRELQRVVQEAVVIAEGAVLLGPEHLPAKLTGAAAALNNTGQLEQRASQLGAVQDWTKKRILAELQIAVAAKRIIVAHKGKQWKAEFMRQVYPHCKTQNAKGFSDLIRRLTRSPWGDPNCLEDDTVTALLKELQA